MAIESTVWQFIGLAMCVSAVVFLCAMVIHRFQYFPDVPWEPTTRADFLVKDWAAGAGYELISITQGSTYARPQLEEFGFAHHGRPGVVRRITVRDEDGELRHGWVFLAAACAVGSGVYSMTGPTSADFLEVAWED